MNRYVLARAERLYKELPDDLRRMLGDLLDGFEAGLQTQEPETIERHRLNLEMFLSLHDPDGENPTGNEEEE